MMKTCTKCGKDKEWALFYFSKKTNRLDTWCIQCKKDNVKKWVAANPERVRATKRKSAVKYRSENYMKTREWIAANRERYAAWKKEWYANNKKKTRGYTAFATYRMKQEILDNYGHRCNNCGHQDDDVLVVDHVNNDGAEHRKVVRNGYSLYKSIKDAGYPPAYQILCCNCNWKKHINGGRLDLPKQPEMVNESSVDRNGKVGLPVCPSCGREARSYRVRYYSSGARNSADKKISASGGEGTGLPK